MRRGRHHGVGCRQPDGSGKLAAQHLADQARQDHRVGVDLSQQPGRQQTLHRTVRRGACGGVAGPTHGRALQELLQEVGLSVVQCREAVGDVGLLSVFDGGLARIPGQAAGGLGGHPHRRVTPHQGALTKIVNGRGDRGLGRAVADQLHKLGQRYGGGIGVQYQQGVEHREMKKVEVIGGGLDRLTRLRPRRQRRDRPRRRLCQVGPQLQQPDQPLVAKFGQPGAQRNTGSVFGHCRPA